MAISGNFSSQAATRQPMAAKPAPNSRHGQMTQPDDNWSAGTSGNGQGAPWAETVIPQMQGRGLMLDLGHRWGHRGSPTTAKARRPFVASRLLGKRVDAPWVETGAAQDAAASAHGDSTTGYYQTHAYAPMPADFAGQSQSVSGQNAFVAPGMGARSVIHGRLGGTFLDGEGGTFAPTGFNKGVPGRWAVAHYSSPTLGAMYSKNTLRGVLPQKISTPYDQPALIGDAGQNSGIAPNRRFLLKSFTTPQLFRSPASMSDAMIAAAPPMPTTGPTMGVGF